jgi:large subunit ribosomal protein L7/L12
MLRKTLGESMDDSAYLVMITSFNPERKIGGIKRLREVTGLGIANAKSLIENCPSEIMSGMYLAQAEELSKLLENAEMTTEIKVDKENLPEIKNLEQIDFDEYEDNHES